MWFIGVEVEQETSAPPPKKNPGSAPEEEKKSWELINWPQGGKCFDLLTNPLNWFFKKKYGSQSGEFLCGYWGLKS